MARCAAVRAQFSKTKSMVRTLQSEQRRRFCTKKYLKSRRAAIVLQALARRASASARFERILNAALRLQHWWLVTVRVRWEAAQLKALTSAVCILQR